MSPERMRLLRIPEPFDHRDWFFELKPDGCRAPVVCSALLMLSLAAPSMSTAQERVGIVGLLRLPEVFGTESCDQFRPREVPLYATPTIRKRIAWIRGSGKSTSEVTCYVYDVKVYREGERSGSTASD